MSPMMRVRLAFVFVVVAALFTATRAVAVNFYRNTYSYRLSPVAADEPDACGAVKVTWVFQKPVSSAFGTVTCKGLMPNAVYVLAIDGLRLNEWGNGYEPYTYQAPFTTDARGSFGTSYSVPCGPAGPSFEVYNAATGELVLE